MGDLYDTTKQNISLHIKKIFDEEELIENSSVKEFLTVQKEENRKVERKVKYYNLVSGYFDFAEIQAIRHNPMHMEDYIRQLDTILSSTGEKLLVGAGTVSHNKAIEKAKVEYKKYQVKTISPVEKEYLETLKAISNKIDDKAKSE